MNDFYRFTDKTIGELVKVRAVIDNKVIYSTHIDNFYKVYKSKLKVNNKGVKVFIAHFVESKQLKCTRIVELNKVYNT